MHAYTVMVEDKDAEQLMEAISKCGVRTLVIPKKYQAPDDEETDEQEETTD